MAMTFKNLDCTWKDKLLLTLRDNLTIADIQVLTETGPRTAAKLYHQTLEYCNKNNLAIYGRSVPTEAVLAVLGRDRKYYHAMAIMEKEYEQSLEPANQT